MCSDLGAQVGRNGHPGADLAQVEQVGQVGRVGRVRQVGQVGSKWGKCDTSITVPHSRHTQKKYTCICDTEAPF